MDGFLACPEKPPFPALALEGAGAGNIARPYELVGGKMGITEKRASNMRTEHTEGMIIPGHS